MGQALRLVRVHIHYGPRGQRGQEVAQHAHAHLHHRGGVWLKRLIERTYNDAVADRHHGPTEKEQEPQVNQSKVPSDRDVEADSKGIACEGEQRDRLEGLHAFVVATVASQFVDEFASQNDSEDGGRDRAPRKHEVGVSLAQAEDLHCVGGGPVLYRRHHKVQAAHYSSSHEKHRALDHLVEPVKLAGFVDCRPQPDVELALGQEVDSRGDDHLNSSLDEEAGPPGPEESEEDGAGGVAEHDAKSAEASEESEPEGGGLPGGELVDPDGGVARDVGLGEALEEAGEVDEVDGVGLCDEGGHGGVEEEEADHERADADPLEDEGEDHGPEGDSEVVHAADESHLLVVQTQLLLDVEQGRGDHARVEVVYQVGHQQQEKHPPGPLLLAAYLNHQLLMRCGKMYMRCYKCDYQTSLIYAHTIKEGQRGCRDDMLLLLPWSTGIIYIILILRCYQEGQNGIELWTICECVISP